MLVIPPRPTYVTVHPNTYADSVVLVRFIWLCSDFRSRLLRRLSPTSTRKSRTVCSFLTCVHSARFWFNAPWKNNKYFIKCPLGLTGCQNVNCLKTEKAKKIRNECFRVIPKSLSLKHTFFSLTHTQSLFSVCLIYYF